MASRFEKEQRRKRRRTRGKSRGGPARQKWTETPLVGTLTVGGLIFVVLFIVAFLLFEELTGIELPKSPRSL